jgi:hypothetical protein
MIAKRKRRTQEPVKDKPDSKYLLGWTNVRWFMIEMVNLYSDKPSFFSKKRIESGLAFTIGQIAMIVYFITKYQTITMTDFMLWAGLEFTIAGYITYQIQRQGYHEDEYSSERQYTDAQIDQLQSTCPTCGKLVDASQTNADSSQNNEQVIP